ncbi:MAG: SDR family oxidoreductase [Kiritimatiellaeota bacterium]|nr:SDR family oxidoreductase [Kiritimatiellota bacterium]
MKLSGQTALVTGGAVRIGRALCEALAAAGVNVVVHYRHSADEAGLLRADLERFGVRAWTLAADLNSEAACDNLVHRAADAAGSLDILINNAAVFHKDNLFATTEAKLLAEFWPNLFAPLLLMRAFANKSSGGKIINLLDRRIAGFDTECVPYVLAKKALAELTQLAARELAPRFTVNGVAPGAVLSPPGQGADYLHDLAGPVPLQKQVTPSDIAAAALALLQNDALTGQILYVDGGQHLL